MTGTSATIACSPSFMIEPLPNCFSIWLSARSSALLLISIAIAIPAPLNCHPEISNADLNLDTKSIESRYDGGPFHPHAHVYGALDRRFELKLCQGLVGCAGRSSNTSI